MSEETGKEEKPVAEFSTNYDLSIVEIPINIGGTSYILREADGEASIKYRNACFACTRFGDKGKVSSIAGLADVEALLVSMCLFSPEGKQVPLKVVRSWPNRVIAPLFQKVKEISGLEKDDEDEDKKEEDLKN